jgi:hypothetical protein
MNIGGAVQILKQGGRVRRRVWVRRQHPVWEYLHIMDGEVRIHTARGNDFDTVLGSADILADDWQQVHSGASVKRPSNPS